MITPADDEKHYNRIRAIEELGLPVRPYNLLKRADVHSFGALAGLDPAALAALGLTEEDIDLARRLLREVGVEGPLTDGE